MFAHRNHYIKSLSNDHFVSYNTNFNSSYKSGYSREGQNISFLINKAPKLISVAFL